MRDARISATSWPAGETSLDIYDPATDTWTSGAPLPTVRAGGVGVALAGQFYVIGGFTSEVVAYNPKTNRWVKKAPFPVPTARFMAGSKVTLNGKARTVVQVGLEDGFPNNGACDVRVYALTFDLGHASPGEARPSTD